MPLAADISLWRPFKVLSGQEESRLCSLQTLVPEGAVEAQRNQGGPCNGPRLATASAAVKGPET